MRFTQVLLGIDDLSMDVNTQYGMNQSMWSDHHSLLNTQQHPGLNIPLPCLILR